MITPSFLFSGFASTALLFYCAITLLSGVETVSFASAAGIAPSWLIFFGKQVNAILEDTLNQFFSIKGFGMARDVGPQSSFASPEFESKVPLEGPRTSIIISDRFSKLSLKAEFHSYEDSSSAANPSKPRNGIHILSKHLNH